MITQQKYKNRKNDFSFVSEHMDKKMATALFERGGIYNSTCRELGQGLTQ